MLDHDDDWRLQGQNQLHAELLRFSVYAPPKRGSEHDCCQFCWKRFKTQAQAQRDSAALRLVAGAAAFLQEGYVTRDRRWICETCYEDFKDIFDWRLES